MLSKKLNWADDKLIENKMFIKLNKRHQAGLATDTRQLNDSSEQRQQTE